MTMFTLRPHLPKQYILWPLSSSHIGKLRPMYILYEHMDPYRVTLNPKP